MEISADRLLPFHLWAFPLVARDVSYAIFPLVLAPYETLSRTWLLESKDKSRGNDTSLDEDTINVRAHILRGGEMGVFRIESNELSDFLRSMEGHVRRF